MTIRFDHIIVPARDKVASTEVFGLTAKPGSGHFAQVQINESLTSDFADQPEPWGGPGFDARTDRSHHYAFHVSAEEFEGILERVRAKGVPCGSGPVITPTARSILAAAGAASTSRIPTVTCSRS